MPGLTEVGPAAVECVESPTNMHVMERDYIAEVIDPHTGAPVPPGQPGELVLTNLGRWGSPLIRYRTGDLVRVDPRPCPCGRPWLRLAGGILGRTDDMIHLRGNNVYPAALEAVCQKAMALRPGTRQTTSLPMRRPTVIASRSAKALNASRTRATLSTRIGFHGCPGPSTL